MPNMPKDLRLIWADKIVLWLAISIVALAALGWLLMALAAGAAGANHVLASIGIVGTLEICAALLVIWATFRALDFAAGGATYKLFHAEPAADAPVLQTPVLPTSRNLLAH